MNTPKGYRFATIEANLKYSGRKDLGLIVSDLPAAAAGVFTTNKFQAAPVVMAKSLLDARPFARAVLINAGNANACTGEQGLANCRRTMELVSDAVGLMPEEILPASTGVIGMQFNMAKWETAAAPLASDLGKSTAEDFSRTIMTTDAFNKIVSRTVEIDGKPVTLLAVAKGAGMICPNMATMLAVFITDAAVDPAMWQEIFRAGVDESFNRVTVDGDTSTNDTVFGLANGASGVAVNAANRPVMQEAVTAVMREIAYKLVQDGEGATKVIHINVTGAQSKEDAELAARTVGHSPLVKTAMYGRDANWGRIVAALGRSGAQFDPEDVVVTMCGVELFRNGQPTDADFDTMLEPYLKEVDIILDIELGHGNGTYTLLASDLTHKYIDINADYRS
ncbi:bifunctional glutamate N-acetyltransferase/amino-acid acetyltransferase ArgJ [Desulfovibrio mangrovi]|uniref:bifunctional glutamate N-acetyltransferase/amino-acid acetyltransferase ArgJ n=1 Tax=Desulfovibrio mangrovi TaxID=2976983 RepID=UPI002246DE1E|nr:bifunctional glutamate N-acetyltransferase/amino-acid acetyltransferase ArgJ [Desulfovibrio mangrovi]UZP67208.1 bifunctional glutamate N-acetyltransferase/amino-acid acetyltransferase ArgJ [Desulfovibrio mangrovi]